MISLNYDNHLKTSSTKNEPLARFYGYYPTTTKVSDLTNLFPPSPTSHPEPFQITSSFSLGEAEGGPSTQNILTSDTFQQAPQLMTLLDSRKCPNFLRGSCNDGPTFRFIHHQSNASINPPFHDHRNSICVYESTGKYQYVTDSSELDVGNPPIKDSDNEDSFMLDVERKPISLSIPSSTSFFLSELSSTSITTFSIFSSLVKATACPNNAELIDQIGGDITPNPDAVSNFLEFNDRFNSENKCLKFLFQNNLLFTSKYCICGSMAYFYEDSRNKIFRCSNRKCYKRISVWKDTIFYSNGIGAVNIFRLIYLFLENYHVSQSQLREATKLSAKTTLSYYKIFRQVCIYVNAKECKPIGGADKTIEIGEIQLNNTKFPRRGKLKPPQIWVVGGICRDTDEFFLELVSERNSTVLTDLIKKNILHGTTLITNCWNDNKDLDDIDYTLYRVSRTPNPPLISGGNCEANIVKHSKDQYMQDYLNAYVYRQKRKYLGTFDVFKLFLKDIMFSYNVVKDKL
ncbi:unnamed protein product [Gordionus sp. m RMFG-2023]